MFGLATGRIRTAKERRPICRLPVLICVATVLGAAVLYCHVLLWRRRDRLTGNRAFQIKRVAFVTTMNISGHLRKRMKYSPRITRTAKRSSLEFLSKRLSGSMTNRLVSCHTANKIWMAFLSPPISEQSYYKPTYSNRSVGLINKTTLRHQKSN